MPRFEILLPSIVVAVAQLPAAWDALSAARASNDPVGARPGAMALARRSLIAELSAYIAVTMSSLSIMSEPVAPVPAKIVLIAALITVPVRFGFMHWLFSRVAPPPVPPYGEVPGREAKELRKGVSLSIGILRVTAAITILFVVVLPMVPVGPGIATSGLLGWVALAAVPIAVVWVARALAEALRATATLYGSGQLGPVSIDAMNRAVIGALPTVLAAYAILAIASLVDRVSVVIVFGMQWFGFAVAMSMMQIWIGRRTALGDPRVFGRPRRPTVTPPP